VTTVISPEWLQCGQMVSTTQSPLLFLVFMALVFTFACANPAVKASPQVALVQMHHAFVGCLVRSRGMVKKVSHRWWYGRP
jgi:hypothetical protein